MGTYLNVARLVKARKRQGRLVVQMRDGLPFLFEEGMTLHIVPPSLAVPRTVVVREAIEGAECSIAFQGIDDYSKLLEYVGRYCLVDRAQIDEGLLAEAPIVLEGFWVHDQEVGNLGQVVDVLESSAQATLVIHGERGEVLVPFVDEFVLDIDVDAQSIETRVPKGLVD